jgi:hypothetical protein
VVKLANNKVRVRVRVRVRVCRVLVERVSAEYYYYLPPGRAFAKVGSAVRKYDQSGWLETLERQIDASECTTCHHSNGTLYIETVCRVSGGGVAIYKNKLFFSNPTTG